VAQTYILATQEVEIGRMAVRKVVIQGQPGQKVHKTPSQPMPECSGVHLSFPAMQRST
jgi:hypothetical protein